jgi:hypothetical protein
MCANAYLTPRAFSNRIVALSHGSRFAGRDDCQDGETKPCGVGTFGGTTRDTTPWGAAIGRVGLGYVMRHTHVLMCCGRTMSGFCDRMSGRENQPDRTEAPESAGRGANVGNVGLAGKTRHDTFASPSPGP